MAFLTNEQVAEKKANGDRMNRLNCGWNLSTENLAAVTIMLNKWEPKTAAEKRDKRICYLAFIKDMNASQIARLKDPLIVGLGNRSKNKPLSPGSILKICYKYVPTAQNRYYKQAKSAKARTELLKDRQKHKVIKPKVCSACGKINDLELHHIIPLSLGGTNDYYNLIYLCHSCHVILHGNIYSKLFFKNNNIE